MTVVLLGQPESVAPVGAVVQYPQVRVADRVERLQNVSALVAQRQVTMGSSTHSHLGSDLLQLRADAQI